MKVNFDINVDSKELQKRIDVEVSNICKVEITKTFREKSQFYEQGIGNKVVKETLNKLIEKELTEDTIRIFFEKNWDRIFTEALERATRHKANALAFSKTGVYLPKN